MIIGVFLQTVTLIMLTVRTNWDAEVIPQSCSFNYPPRVGLNRDSLVVVKNAFTGWKSSRAFAYFSKRWVHRLGGYWLGCISLMPDDKMNTYRRERDVLLERINSSQTISKTFPWIPIFSVLFLLLFFKIQQWRILRHPDLNPCKINWEYGWIDFFLLQQHITFWIVTVMAKWWEFISGSESMIIHHHAP